MEGLSSPISRRPWTSTSPASHPLGHVSPVPLGHHSRHQQPNDRVPVPGLAPYDTNTPPSDTSRRSISHQHHRSVTPTHSEDTIDTKSMVISTVCQCKTYCGALTQSPSYHESRHHGRPIDGSHPATVCSSPPHGHKVWRSPVIRTRRHPPTAARAAGSASVPSRRALPLPAEQSAEPRLR